jgi:hypothetical protein
MRDDPPGMAGGRSTDEYEPQLAFYCPECARQEFGVL